MGHTSQFSSGDPPYPTVPSHWFAWHTLHPSSTASRAEASELSRDWYAASVAWVKGPPHVLITMGRPGELEARPSTGMGDAMVKNKMYEQSPLPRLVAMAIYASKLARLRTYSAIGQHGPRKRGVGDSMLSSRGLLIERLQSINVLTRQPILHAET